jgi:hypothetical protein
MSNEQSAEMRRIKARTFYAAIAFAFVAAVGWYLYSIFAMPEIRPHVGDGRFANHSWRFPWVTVGIPVTGYTIEFDHFDLSSDYDASYRLEQLPIIGKEAVIYLCISDPNHKWRTDDSRRQLTATVEFDIIDGRGQSVCSVKQRLGKMYWAEPEGGKDTYGLYVLPESEFEPQRSEKYRIHLHYSADPQLSGLEGFAWIRCGGSI